MSLIPAKQNFKVWRGATFRHTITVYTDDAGTVLRDLTGYSALLEIRDEPNSGAPIYTLSTTNSGITLGGSAGTIALVISATDTAALTWDSGVYDLTITAPSAGDTDALLFGSFVVLGV